MKKYFEHKDVTYVHAPKTGSRSIIGWLVLLKEPDLYKKHPEWFAEVKAGDPAYFDIRSRIEPVAHIQQPITFAVTRDPVKRFISNYKNRVITHNRLKSGQVSFDKFVDKFEYYWDVSGDVKLHFRPLSYFYKGTPDKYTHIFRTEQLDECRKFLSEHFEQELPKLRLQQNVPQPEINPTEKQLQKIKKFYEQDYANGWI